MCWEAEVGFCGCKTCGVIVLLLLALQASWNPGVLELIRALENLCMPDHDCVYFSFPFFSFFPLLSLSGLNSGLPRFVWDYDAPCCIDKARGTALGIYCCWLFKLQFINHT
ncbi:hypothetical protein BS78_05G093300 [Paspalum vaginatum]|nr:hypothetical protein BS78_05G093300 [Paspalum vaginatum]